MWLGFGEVGREDERPSDKNGVLGNLMENSLGEVDAGDPLSAAPSFSCASTRIGGGRIPVGV